MLWSRRRGFLRIEIQKHDRGVSRHVIRRQLPQQRRIPASRFQWRKTRPGGHANRAARLTISISPATAANSATGCSAPAPVPCSTLAEGGITSTSMRESPSAPIPRGRAAHRSLRRNAAVKKFHVGLRRVAPGRPAAQSGDRDLAQRRAARKAAEKSCCAPPGK